MNEAFRYFLLDSDQLRRLRVVTTRLHYGTDRERDFGHELWLILNEIEHDIGPLDLSLLDDLRADLINLGDKP